MKQDVCNDRTVIVARENDCSYDRTHDLLVQLFSEAEWDAAHAHSEAWNPLGELVRPGDVVVLKPNWVHHENQSGQGMECMLTHPAVIDRLLDFVLRARPSKVIVGDAPVQGCRFDTLMSRGGYLAVKERHERDGAPVEWADFRRTVRDESRVLDAVRSDVKPEEDYVLFDLGTRSLLEPISNDAEKFRVTMYNPDLMLANHRPGRHRYLIARDIMAADVIINLPKLKTHKKSGVTGALKNLVGINGNKEFLPHHRVGGAGMKGDCYAGTSRLKYAAEKLLDASNRRRGLISVALLRGAQAMFRLARVSGEDANLEGSWYGNDTIWRTCLDLNRVFLYGCADGTLAETPQRRVLTITDAIVCGEGEGPLAPTPRPLGVMTMSSNAAAAEVVHAWLMGFDWRKLSIVREAFGSFDLPIARFDPEAVEVRMGGERVRFPWPSLEGAAFVAPRHWRGHCERDGVVSSDRPWTYARFPEEDA